MEAAVGSKAGSPWTMPIDRGEDLVSKFKNRGSRDGRRKTGDRGGEATGPGEMYQFDTDWER